MRAWPNYIRGASLFVLLALGPAAPQEPSFRVDVRLVSVLATVKNATGELVASLGKEDFSITDNGVPQEISLFERRTEQPLSIALLIDTSSSTGIKLKEEITSARRFLEALVREGNNRDALCLFSFNESVTLQSSFTRRPERLDQALRGLRAEGGTSVYDALVFASRELESREGRKVVVVVTDGGDTTSTRSFHDALEALQRADTVLYGILIVPIRNDPGRNVGGENALQQFASGTGGRVFLPTLGPALDAVFDDILKELRTQYFLAFYPRNVPLTKNRFHRLGVKVKRPGLHVLARTGYYGESAGSAAAPLLHLPQAAE